MNNLSKIQAALDKLRNNQQSSDTPKSNNLWKPSDGDNVIRILPNMHIGASELPFYPLEFYYKFGRTYLAPYQFDKPDPILDWHNTLLGEARSLQETDKGKSKEIWMLAQQFKSQLRIYVPVLVRGKEDEGVKWWGFSPKTFADLDSIFNDPDYGNIADVKSGRDITVKYVPKEKSSTDFAQISVLPKPKETPASTDKTVLESIKNMPNVVDFFTIPTESELSAELEKYLNANQPKKSNAKPELSASNDDFNMDNLAADLDKLFEN